MKELIENNQGATAWTTMLRNLTPGEMLREVAVDPDATTRERVLSENVAETQQDLEEWQNAASEYATDADELRQVLEESNEDAKRLEMVREKFHEVYRKASLEGFQDNDQMEEALGQLYELLEEDMETLEANKEASK